jgi:putative transposase
MRKSQYTDQQVAFALQQAEGGTPVPEVCRKMGVSEATFYRWKQKYGGLMPSRCGDCARWRRRTRSFGSSSPT